MIVALLIVGYVACCVLSMCLDYAYFQKERRIIAELRYEDHTLLCFWTGIFGPISLITSLIFLSAVNEDGKPFKHGLLFPGSRKVIDEYNSQRNR